MRPIACIAFTVELDFVRCENNALLSDLCIPMRKHERTFFPDAFRQHTGGAANETYSTGT